MHIITGDTGVFAAKQPSADGPGGFDSLLLAAGETRPQQPWELFLAAAQNTDIFTVQDEDLPDDEASEATPATEATGGAGPAADNVLRGDDTAADDAAAAEVHLGDVPVAETIVHTPAVFSFPHPKAMPPMSLPAFTDLTAAPAANVLAPAHSTLPVSLPLFVPTAPAPVIPGEEQYNTQPMVPLNGGKMPGVGGLEPSSAPLILPPPMIAHAPLQVETAPLPQAVAPPPAAAAALPEGTQSVVPGPSLVAEIAAPSDKPTAHLPPVEQPAPAQAAVVRGSGPTTPAAAAETHTTSATSLPVAVVPMNIPAGAEQAVAPALPSATAHVPAPMPAENIPATGVLATVPPGGIPGGEQTVELNVSHTPVVSPVVSAIPPRQATVTGTAITSAPAVMPVEHHPASGADIALTRTVTIAPEPPPALPVFLPQRPSGAPAAAVSGNAPAVGTTPPAAPELPAIRPLPIPVTFAPAAPVMSADTPIATVSAATAFAVNPAPVYADVVAAILVQALKTAVEGLSQQLAEGKGLSPAVRDVMPQGATTAPALGPDTAPADGGMRAPLQAMPLIVQPGTAAPDPMPVFPAEPVIRMQRTDLPDETRGLFRELSVELDPPELGRMLVRVTETRGRLAAAVTVEQIPARIAVEQVESHVRQVLGRQGVEIGSFEVSCRGDDAFAQSHQFGRSAHPAGAENAVGMTHAPQNHKPAANASVHHGQVDVYA